MRIVPKIWSTDVPGIGLIISVVAPLDDARGTVMVLVIRSRAAAALTVGHTPLMAHDDVSGAGFTISLVVPLDEARAAVMVQVIRSRAAAALTMGHTNNLSAIRDGAACATLQQTRFLTAKDEVSAKHGAFFATCEHRLTRVSA
eukprot:s124_g27.t1